MFQSQRILKKLRALFFFLYLIPVIVHGAGVEQLLDAYQKATTPEAKQAALNQLLNAYPSYKHHVAERLGTGAMTPEFKKLTREIDEKIVQMTQDTWRTVLKNDPAAVNHVIPVGSLGDRLTNPAYIPGKSDKDMIPVGPRASETVEKFRRAFVQQFGIAPEKLDINVLDPTNPSSWPGRVDAVANVEKYNTVGGNNWLQKTTYEKNPTVWQFDGKTGRLTEAEYRAVAGQRPPSLTPQDAAGFFSDNTRFRNELVAKYGENSAELILKQSKYDLRNAAAYGLAGGKFTAEEAALMQAAGLARKGEVDEAIKHFATKMGLDVSTEAGKQAAMKAYLEKMNALTEKMAQKVVATHLDEIAKAGTGSKFLVSELAGVLHNLPPSTREKVISELSKDVAKAETLKIANSMAQKLAKDVFIKTAFDEAAMKLFGKPYDQLSSAEKLLVHNAGDEVAGSLDKFAKGMGITLVGAAIIYSAYEAYAAESSRGMGIGAAAAMGRGILDLIQLGTPPLAAIELAGRAAVFGIKYGIDGMKMDVLDKLYERFKTGASLEDLLNDAEFQKYYAAGLRQFRLELREAAEREGKPLTDEQLDKALRDYFANRLQIEKQGQLIQRDLAWAQAFVNSRRIPLVPGSDSDLDNSQLSQDELNAALARLLLLKLSFEQQLRADGVPFTKQAIAHLLFLAYKGKPGDLEAALNDLYRNVGKTYPPGKKVSKKPKTTTQVSDGKTSEPKKSEKGMKIIQGSNATVVRGEKRASDCAGGVLLSGGGSFREKGVDQACDPPISLGSADVECAGDLTVSVRVDKPVPQTWSLFNHNTAVGVGFEPRLGGKLGRGYELGSIRPGANEKEASVTLTVPGPGRISAGAVAPRGAGPLSGSCFGQSFSAQLTFTPHREVPVAHESRIHPGDVIQTHGGWSKVALVTPANEKIALGANDQRVRVEEKAGGGHLVVDESSSYNSQIHYSHRGPRADAAGRPTTFRSGKTTITPRGTEFIIQHYPPTTSVLVLQGHVEVTDDDGRTTVVGEGQQFALHDWSSSALDKRSVAGIEWDGLAVSELLPDPVESSTGTVGAWHDGEAIEPGWVVVDAKRDARFAPDSESSATICVTVPPGNELNNRVATAPMLFHAVSGDFDLEGTVDVETTATDNALVHFVVHKPGGYLGLHDGQGVADVYAAHFWRLGGLQLIRNRWEMTTITGAGHRENFETSPTQVRLRLTRRGNLWKSYASFDHGISWNLMTRSVMDTEPTLYVGWVFQRAAYDRLNDVVANFRLQNVHLEWAPTGSLEPSEWDICAPYGMASADDEGIVAVVTDVAKAASRIETGAPLEGNFDLVADYEVLSWRSAPYEVSGFSFYVCDTRHRNFAYIGRWDGPTHGERLHTDLRQDESWHRGYQWVKSTAQSGRLRIRRERERITTYYWDRDHWEQLDKGFNGGWTTPVYVGLMVSNEENRAVPASVGVRVRLSQAEVASEVRPAEKIKEEGRVEFLPASLANDLVLPEGWDAAALESPYTLGTLLPTADWRGVYVLSHEREAARCIKVSDELRVTETFTTDLLAGINRKVGLELDGSLWLGIDGWHESGNRYGGIFQVDQHGRWWRQIEAAQNLYDIGAMTTKQGRSLLIGDFGRGGIFEYIIAADKLVPIIESSTELRGVVGLAYDVGRMILMGVTSKSHGAAPSGVYIIDLSQQPIRTKLAYSGQEEDDFLGIVYDTTTAYKDDVIISVANADSLLRVDTRTGQKTVLVRGIPRPGYLRWGREALWVVSGEKYLVRLKPNNFERPTSLAPTPVSTSEASSGASMTPARTGASPPSQPTSSLGERQERASNTKTPQRFVFRSPKDSVLIKGPYPTKDFAIELRLAWEKPGSIVDTVGINAAPQGAWALIVEPGGKITFQIYDPQTKSPIKASNGWHIMRSQKAIPSGQPVFVRVERLGTACDVTVDGESVARAELPTALSGAPAYLGDFPGDAQWAPRYPTQKGFCGWVELHYFGPSRKAETQTIKADPVGALQKPQFTPDQVPSLPLAELRSFAGQWEIQDESGGVGERELVILRILDDKLVGTAGRDRDLLEFSRQEKGQLVGSVRPADGSAPMPVTARLSKDGNILTLKVAPPASEYVVVKAKRIQGAADNSRRIQEIREQLRAVSRKYQEALATGSEEDIRAAKAELDALQRELDRISPK